MPVLSLVRSAVVVACIACTWGSAKGQNAPPIPEDEVARQLSEAQEIEILSNEPQIIYEQLVDTRNRIARIQEFLDRADATLENLAEFAQFSMKLDALIAAASKTSCVDGVPAELSSAQKELLALIIGFRPPGRSKDVTTFQLEVGSVAADDCNALVANLADKGKMDNLRKAAETLQQSLAGDRSGLEKQRDTINEALVVLQQKKTELLNALRAGTTREQLGENLWAVIAALGCVGIATMLVVSLFKEKIQDEWVGSGQVTQYVTVMILLSVILGLGLSDVLGEEILGTLLGGISGYVLSQGVGRAVARAAERRVPTEEPKPPVGGAEVGAPK